MDIIPFAGTLSRGVCWHIRSRSCALVRQSTMRKSTALLLRARCKPSWQTTWCRAVASFLAPAIWRWHVWRFAYAEKVTRRWAKHRRMRTIRKA